uniref:Chromosome 5 open reading frame 22 n=1 Tax=Sinocyclocheilus grahami TaxID=75366 RepID=A0A672MKL0_SINGR
MKTPPQKRVYPKLPMWIVEDHHEAVKHIYRAIGSKHIPMKGIKMVYLNSHPDLLIPVNMSADTVYDKETLFSELSTEIWIMPMVYAGHVSHVAWLHPYWAQQIKEGEHSMCVGKDSSTTTIRVTSRDDYILSDALYVPLDQLENPKELHLNVIRVDPVDSSQKRTHANGQSGAKIPKSTVEDSDVPSTASGNGSHTVMKADEGSTNNITERLLAVIEQTDPFILDIDLDFFSCKNPFKEMYTQEEYALLQELYSFSRPLQDSDEEELLDCAERRTHQLEDLEAAFAELVEDDGQETVERLAANPRMKSLVRLVHSLKNRTQTPDYEMLHQAGLTCDYSELPNHISSEEEIQQMITAVQLFLEALPKPTIVTISRSSLDEYCPVVLNILESLFGCLDVQREYESIPSEITSQTP